MKKNNGTIPHKPPFENIEILICWNDGFGEGKKSFRTVHELAYFLKENPEFAKAVEYVSKNKTSG